MEMQALLQSRADQNGGKFERRRNGENIGSFSPIADSIVWILLKAGRAEVDHPNKKWHQFCIKVARWHQGGSKVEQQNKRWHQRQICLQLVLLFVLQPVTGGRQRQSIQSPKIIRKVRKGLRVENVLRILGGQFFSRSWGEIFSRSEKVKFLGGLFPLAFSS